MGSVVESPAGISRLALARLKAGSMEPVFRSLLPVGIACRLPAKTKARLQPLANKTARGAKWHNHYARSAITQHIPGVAYPAA